jgi:hypothetical protein
MTFEGSRGIIFEQIAYLFEKCKQCITIYHGKGNIRTMSERHDKPTALLHQEGNKVGKNMKFATHPFDNYFTTTLFSTYDHLKSQLIELDG